MQSVPSMRSSPSWVCIINYEIHDRRDPCDVKRIWIGITWYTTGGGSDRMDIWSLHRVYCNPFAVGHVICVLYGWCNSHIMSDIDRRGQHTWLPVYHIWQVQAVYNLHTMIPWYRCTMMVSFVVYDGDLHECIWSIFIGWWNQSIIMVRSAVSQSNLHTMYLK